MDADEGEDGGPREASGVAEASPQHAIRVEGHLDARWASSFDGMTLTNASDGTTTIRGPLLDQAALHGLLHQLRDIGIPLISLTQLESDH